MATESPELPASLREEWEKPPLARRPWQEDLAPTYIGLFLLILYFDQLPMRTLSVGGLLPAVLGAVVAGLLCFGLLYLAPALWGWRTGRPFMVVATRTFGASGALWLPGGLYGLVQVVWLAVAINYGADVALGGLVEAGLIAPEAFDPLVLWGLTWRSPLVLFVTLLWCLTAGAIGIYFPRITAALLKGYVIFPALTLGGVTIWALGGLGGFQPLTIDPVTAEPVRQGAWQAGTLMVQFVFGFFATFGAAAVDWGAVSRDPRDVRRGGLVSVGLAAPILATLALLIVVGTLGREPGRVPTLAADLSAQVRLEDGYAQGVSGPELDSARRQVQAIGARNFTVQAAIRNGIGGNPAAAILLIFGMPLLGPAVYAPYLFGYRFAAIAPRVPRWAWSLLGSLAAWPLVASGLVGRLGSVYDLLGALMAPVVGALTADFLRSRGAWTGPRRGLNPAGWISWAVGLAVGLLPTLGRLAAVPALIRFQPAALLAFLAAFVTYALLASLGLETSEIPLPAPRTLDAEPPSASP